MKYLWQDLDKITTKLKTPCPTVLLFDFDGTLAPIAQSPQQAKLPTKTRSLLQKLITKDNFYIAVISGRPLSDLRSKIQLSNIIYAGLHGFEGEIYGKKYNFPVTENILTTMPQIKKKLTKVANKFSGAFVEDKTLMLAFHFRAVAKQQINNLKLSFYDTLKPFEAGQISIMTGKKVFEVCPKVNWSKGHFVNLVIKQIEKLTRAQLAVIYIGDDATDEEVFKILKNEISVRVGHNQKSQARYFLKDTKDVFNFLNWIESLS